MTTAYDVPANPLIEELAATLEAEVDDVEPPQWAVFAKTGVDREKPPQEEGWWYTRAAAVLRKVYTKGPIGTERLRSEFGGKKNRGAQPDRFAKGSGSVIRNCLQQLEAAGLVEEVSGQGRQITAEGQSFADEHASEVLEDLADERPELTKY